MVLASLILQILQSRRASLMLPCRWANLRLWCRLEQYWQYSLLTITQVREMRKVVAAQSIQTIMESSELNEQDLSSWLKRQMEKRENQHSFAEVLEELSIDFSLEERRSPSATSAEQSSMIMSITLRLSQMILEQKAHLPSSILHLTQRFLSLGLFFMRRREAYISMRKKIKASSERVQTQQRGSASKKQMTRAIASSMLSRMTRGPILSMLVNIGSLVQCKINPLDLFQLWHILLGVTMLHQEN